MMNRTVSVLVLLFLSTFCVRADWIQEDIGSVGAAGVATEISGTYSVSGAGAGVTGMADALSYVSQSVSGDFEITARIDSLSAESPYTAAGLMLRENSSASAKNVFVFVSAENGVNFSARSTSGETLQTLGSDTGSPVWLRLLKVGADVLGFRSADGCSWELVGRASLDGMDTCLVGMAVSSAVSGTLSNATISSVSLTANLPFAVPGLRLWLRSDAGVTLSGSTVQFWEDQSGHGNSASQENPSFQPTWVENQLNGLPVLRFNGTNSYLSIPDATTLRPDEMTVFVVGKHTGGDADGLYLAKASSASFNDGFGILSTSSGTSAGLYVNRRSQSMTDVPFPGGTYGILSGRFDGEQVRFSHKGHDSAFSMYSTPIIHSAGPLYLGSFSGATKRLGGDIAEVLLFDRSLNVSEIAKVEAYLSGKYSLEVSVFPSVQPGVYSAAQVVSLYAPQDAEIYYTTDGSNPSSSSMLYNGPISIAATTVLKAIYVQSGVPTSSVFTFSYTIDGVSSLISRSELDFWLSADLGVVESGGSVVRWIDQSGSGNDALAVSPSTGPVLQPNAIGGKPVLRFNGVDQYLELGGALSSANRLPFTLMVVTRGATNPDGLFDSDPISKDGFVFSGSSAEFAGRSPSLNFSLNAAGGTITVIGGVGPFGQRSMSVFGNGVNEAVTTRNYNASNSPGTISILNPFGVVASVTLQGVADDSLAVSGTGNSNFVNSSTRNGATENTYISFDLGATDSFTITATNGTGGYNGYSIGGVFEVLGYVPGSPFFGNSSPVVFSTPRIGRLSARYFSGDIAEVLLYRRILSQQERIDIESYFSQKYGIANTVPGPIADFNGGIFGTTRSVTLSAPAGSIIYFTTDGSTPTIASTLYTGPVTVDHSLTLKSIAVSASGGVSAISEETYLQDLTASFSARNDLALWLRADQGVTQDGSAVSAWADQSGNRNHAVQETGVKQPVALSGAINGHEAVKFDGTNDSLAMPTTPELKPENVTVFVVGKHTDGAAAYRTYFRGGGNAISEGYAMLKRNSASAVGFNINAFNASFASGALATDTYGVMVGQYDGTKVDLYLNGLLAASAANATGVTTYDSSSLSYVGSTGTSYYLKGEIAELLVFDRTLSETERKEVESYLYQRYNVGGAPQLPGPQVTTGRIFSGSQTVEMDSPIDGGTIRFTLDGSDPTGSSAVYDPENPPTLTSTTTVKTKVFKYGYADSQVVTTMYTLDPATGSVVREGLSLWLRADAGMTVSGSNVGQWNDQSGRGNHAVQGTAVNQPVALSGAINGHQAVKFDGTNDYLAMPTTLELKPENMTIFVVGKHTDGANAYRTYFRGGGNAISEGYAMLKRNSASAVGFNINAFNSGFSAGALATDTYGVMMGQYDGSKVDFYLNGLLAASVANTTGVTSYDSTSLSYVGSTGASYYLKGEIAELLVFDRALSETERKEVELYLHERYNVGNSPQLPAPDVTGATIFNQSQTVEMASSVDGGTIRFTLDGSDPTESSAVYDPENPPTLSSTTTVKTKVFKDGYADSPVVTTVYTLDSATGSVVREGLSLWLRADAGMIVSGSNVGQWNDQSGKGNHAVQGTAVNQPVALSGAINGHEAVKFDGTNDCLAMPTTLELKPANVTIFVVGKHTDGANAYRTYFRGGGNAISEGYAMLKRNSASAVGFNINAYNTNFAAGTLAADTYGVMVGEYDGTEANFYLNGILAASVANTTGVTTYDSTSLSYVGSTGASYYLKGEIAELLVFDRSLSEAERKEVESYLYQRYVIGSAPQLPAPLLTFAPIFSGSQTVTMDSPIPDATIRYTVDGSDPSLSSTEYTVPLILAATTTVKARSFKNGYGDSGVTAVTYTKDDGANFDQAGLKLWLRADMGVSSGTSGAVNAWEDLSGQGNDAIQASGVNQPVWIDGVAGGHPVLRFDGANDYLSVADSAGLKPEKFTMYVVAKRTGGGNSGAIFYKSSSTSYADGYGLVREGAGNVFGFYVNSNSTTKATGTILPGNYFLAKAIYDQARAVLLVNGEPQTQVTYSTAIAHSTEPMRIGGKGSAAYSFGGDVAEILLFDHKLTLEEEIAVEKYLGERYDLTTDADGDGLPRWKELLLGTDPNNADTNGNGVSDGAEYNSGFDPTSNDSDGDGLTNAQEYALGTNAFWADSDGDGVNDGSDPYPLDPTASSNTDPTPSTAPIITLELPGNAVLLP